MNDFETHRLQNSHQIFMILIQQIIIISDFFFLLEDMFLIQFLIIKF